ncbi:hypothetical protein ES319_D12G101100v1 [Gossypium barbadense]|uniref:Uncharacterized protein n=1 Tax=Gossypium barbadense TaxID=3634 RepID=A0A5J5NZ49_GOSBA|nr:hypothetical protein ES319_D12G101100v1 [Gossypium barbadense]
MSSDSRPHYKSSSFLIKKLDATCCFASEKPASTFTLTQFVGWGFHFIKALGLGFCNVPDSPQRFSLKCSAV